MRTVNASVKYAVLYSFKGSSGGARDGSAPLAGLTEYKGALYGTTSGGGTPGDGTVYAIGGAGKESVLYSSRGRPERTRNRDCSSTTACCTVRRTPAARTVRNCLSITPAGKERVLHSFGSFDGENPAAGLVVLGGTLYGVTYNGGANGDGAVFAVTTVGKERVTYSFSGNPDGQNPQGSLTVLGGNLYGTTVVGGTNVDGVLFEITPAGVEHVAYTFGNAYDVVFPNRIFSC